MRAQALALCEECELAAVADLDPALARKAVQMGGGGTDVPANGPPSLKRSVDDVNDREPTPGNAPTASRMSVGSVKSAEMR